jgi:hypothetical protein
VKVITFSDEALRNIDNMQQRLWSVANEYGPSWHSRETQMIEESLLNAMLTIIRFPGQVFAEDDLSLIINSFITIGIIWHPKKHKDENGEWQRDPLLGEWSSHS